MAIALPKEEKEKSCLVWYKYYLANEAQVVKLLVIAANLF